MASWAPLARDYGAEGADNSAQRSRVSEHPLLSSKQQKEQAAAKKESTADAPTKDKSRARVVSDDPLSMMLGDDPMSDPLCGLGPMSAAPPKPPSGMSTASAAADDDTDIVGPNNALIGSAWNAKKEAILSEYSVSGKIKVTASFLDGAEDAASENKSVALSKAKARVEQLEAANAAVDQDKVSLTQKEYTDQIEKLHEELSDAWNNAERVKSLKIAIQCSKVLGDVAVPQFYPSMWVLVTEILDTFGQLVFDRIRRLAIDKSERSSLPANFTAADIPPMAKETCRNWFFKIACIRELVPRLYVEMALLRCYRFLSDDEYPQILARISNVIRGVGDPLLAVYCRAYLARSGAQVAASLTDNAHLLSALYDYLFSMPEYRSQRKAAFCDRYSLGDEEYDHLHDPALQWLVKAVSIGSKREHFVTVMQQFREHSNAPSVLLHILAEFPPAFYAPNALGVVSLIQSTDCNLSQRALLFSKLAAGLTKVAPPQDQKLPLLNEVWRAVSKLDELQPYAECSAAFVELTMLHYSEKEVLVLLKDLVKHIQPHGSEGAKEIAPCLERVCRAVCADCSDFGAILTSDQFMRLMDMFKSEKKTMLCKSLLESFGRSKEMTSDPVVIHTIFAVARDLHDSIDSLSFDDERRQIAVLICQFIERVDFDRDLEQQFNVYVDCRAAFPNLDAVKDRLVLAVVSLIMKAHRYVKGKHTKKTAGFVKACLAYCHITIPSIDNTFKRLSLFQLCGSVALANQCLPQTDTFLKAAIALVAEVPTHEEVDSRRVSTEPSLVTFLQSFASTLVVVPGHPEHGPFYLVKGLLNAIERYEWQENSGAKARVLISLLPLLCAYGQRTLPYTVPKVDSNDVLYGGKASYLTELATYVNSVVDKVMDELVALGKSENAAANAKQCTLVIELANTLLVGCKVDEGANAKIVRKLLAMAKTKASFKAELAFLKNTVDMVGAWGNSAKASGSDGRASQADAYGALAREVLPGWEPARTAPKPRTVRRHSTEGPTLG